MFHRKQCPLCGNNVPGDQPTDDPSPTPHSNEDIVRCKARGGVFHRGCVERAARKEDGLVPVFTDTGVCILCFRNPPPPEHTPLVPQIADGTTAGYWLAIQEAWERYPSQKLSNLFETQRVVHQKIVEMEGGNQFHIPHHRKRKLTLTSSSPAKRTPSTPATPSTSSWSPSNPRIRLFPDSPGPCTPLSAPPQSRLHNQMPSPLRDHTNLQQSFTPVSDHMI